MVLRSYYLGVFKDQRPEIWPLFFRVDWAPAILEFLLRFEGKHYDCRGTLMKGTNHVVHPVYLFIMSCLPLSAAVASLRVALDARGSAQLEGHVSGSSTTVGIALLVGIAGIILAGLATLREFMKVIHLEAPHRLLAHVVTWGIMLSLWLAFFGWVASSISAVHDKAWTDGLPAPDTDKYYVDLIMGEFAFLLFFPEDLPPAAALLFRSLKGAAVAAVSIEWTICEDSRNPHYMLFVCGMVVFFLLRVIATFTSPWRSFISGMRKVIETAYDVVRSPGSRV